MFIINPDPYLLPSYLISPFQTLDIATNNRLPESNDIDYYFKERFKNQNFTYTFTGRTAIQKSLQHYNLQPDDVITILTTSNNFYISGCVTAEIEKFCTWNREITDKTKLIFVNHEFGFPYKNLKELKKYKLPIIEDCAHSFFSEDDQSEIGKVGDFAIYSFPKMFPIQIGGLLVSNIETSIETDLDEQASRYIKKVLSHYIIQEKSIVKKRIHFYKKLRTAFKAFGFTERFALKEGIVPGVFMFNVNNTTIDLVKMKVYLFKHGIQSSVFFGEQAFFIPVHQHLKDEDVLYFKEVLGSFLSKESVIPTLGVIS